MKMFVTYGCGSDQRNCYSVVEGADVIDCIEKVQATCGRHYAFTYTDEQDFERQIRQYGLHEIPLHAQTIPPHRGMFE